MPLRHGIGLRIAVGAHIESLPEMHLGYVYLPAPFGAKAAHRMKVELLRKLFSVLLIVLATKLLWKVLG